jgi:hypothetical protein
MKMIGTIMMSSNNSIESAARPTGDFVPLIGRREAQGKRRCGVHSARQPHKQRQCAAANQHLERA